MTSENLKHAMEQIEPKPEMYDRILKDKKSRRSWGLPVCASVCVLVLLFVAGLFAWSVHYQLRFRAFVGDLSDGIIYAYQNDCLQAQVDGELIRVSDKNTYKIYNYITQNGPGRVRRQPPQTDCDAVLRFGNGAVLRLWSVKEQDIKYLVLYFENPQGETYCYATTKLLLENFTANYLYPGSNELWEE